MKTIVCRVKESHEPTFIFPVFTVGHQEVLAAGSEEVLAFLVVVVLLLLGVVALEVPCLVTMVEDERAPSIRFPLLVGIVLCSFRQPFVACLNAAAIK